MPAAKKSEELPADVIAAAIDEDRYRREVLRRLQSMDERQEAGEARAARMDGSLQKLLVIAEAQAKTPEPAKSPWPSVARQLLKHPYALILVVALVVTAAGRIWPSSGADTALQDMAKTARDTHALVQAIAPPAPKPAHITHVHDGGLP